MEHYSYEEWVIYVENGFDLNKRKVMEDHLYSCEVCTENYLLAITAHQDDVEDLINPSFTDDVMSLISDIDITQLNQQRRISKKQILKYYTIAASITVILLHMGVFDFIGASIPKAAVELADSTKQVERVMTNRWTDKLMNSTVQFFDVLSTKQRSEFYEKK